MPVDVLTLIRAALQREPCRKLFAEGVDPSKLFEDLLKGGNIQFADLGGVDPDTRGIANASTSAVFGSRMIKGHVGPHVIRQSAIVGATITINSNSAAQFQTGYNRRFGATDPINRAVTLIHELGHAANAIFSAQYPKGASQILETDTGPTPEHARRSQLNSFMVYNECFGSAPGQFRATGGGP